MQINKISSANSFGKITMGLDAYECMRNNGASKSDMRRLYQMNVRGGDANIYYVEDEGFFLGAKRAGDVFIGNNPTYNSVVKVVNSYNGIKK